MSDLCDHVERFNPLSGNFLEKKLGLLSKEVARCLPAYLFLNYLHDYEFKSHEPNHNPGF